MPATIAAVSGGAAPAGGSAPTSAVQTSAGTDAKTSTAPAPASKPGESPKPDAPKVPEPPRRFKAKAKFDGKDQDIDLEESEVVREIQKARHHDRTRGDFEKQRSEFQQTLKALSENPLGFLAERGVDLTELAAQKVQRDSELAKLTPEARELAEAKAEIERLTGAEQKRVQTEAQAAEAREQQELVQTTVRTLDSAIKLSGQKRSGELVKLYAEVMELAETNGEPPLSPEQLVAAGERLETRRLGAGLKRAATDPAWRARNGALMKDLAQAIFPALDGQELIDFVGPANAVKLAKAQLAAFHKNPLPMIAETPPDQQPAAPAKPKEAPPGSMFGMLDKLAGR